MELPYIPADVPFSGDQKAWLAGFLAGLNTRINMAPGAPGLPAVGPAAAAAVADSGPVAVQIVYGTQTGTAEYLATELATAARAKGFLPLVCGLDELEISTLAAVRRLLVITSTYGEGDMPDNAELFWQALAAPTAPPLPGLFYSVLALGDSSYDGYCQAGKNIDARLAELGATRVLDRTDCDLDYEDPAAAWTSAALDALTGVDADAAPSPAEIVPATPAEAAAPTKAKWGRKNPYRAQILANTVLSGPGSDKEVRHVVLSLGDSGITYRPGDGISIAPINDPALVAALVARLGVSGDTVIADRKGETTLTEALTHRFEISTPSKYLVDYIAQRSQDPELTHLTATGDREALDAWLWGRDVLDLLNVDAALPITPEELIAELRPLQPRVYSISSSPLAHADTVHITMATVRYRSGDRVRGGVCSTFLADRCEVGSDVGVFISTNNSFRLPENDDTGVIMIGPGTGIAPFRSFLHERASRGASGRNWLFFGDQHQASDFSYSDELDQLTADGVLSRLDLAFSRDQDHKIYVQDRMREAGAELFAWLNDGAHLYVCGDATRMARDVDAALHGIVAKHGGFDPASAQDYINALKKSKRYVRDVY